MSCNKIYVFAGTSEGRQISEFLTKENQPHEVFVATEYGASQLVKSTKARVHVGRLDLEDMVELFRKEEPDLIVDATHSFATLVSENIRQALEQCHMSQAYLRVKRDMVDLETVQSDLIIRVSDTKQAVDAINDIVKNSEGNILLTTGVKTLKEYMDGISFKERIYARILPSLESIEEANNIGLDMGHIIAMEGPFTRELNEALINQYNISCLVGKNSGKKGGIVEKITAAIGLNIPIVIIDNPDKEDGLGLEEAVDYIRSNILSGNVKEDEGVDDNRSLSKDFTIVGIGMGDKKSITLEAVEKIQEAEVIIGASRMLETGRKYNPFAEFKTTYMFKEVLEIFKASDKTKIVYLISGDSGFYSGTRAVSDAFCKEGFSPVILPGVSSVSYLAAKAKRPYSDSLILSCHGKSDDEIEELLGENFNKGFAKKDQAYIICSGLADAKKIYDHVNQLARDYEKESNYQIDIMVGYNMGSDGEEYFTNCDSFDKEGLYIIGVFKKLVD